MNHVALATSVSPTKWERQTAAEPPAMPDLGPNDRLVFIPVGVAEITIEEVGGRSVRILQRGESCIVPAARPFMVRRGLQTGLRIFGGEVASITRDGGVVWHVATAAAPAPDQLRPNMTSSDRFRWDREKRRLIAAITERRKAIAALSAELAELEAELDPVVRRLNGEVV